MVAITFNSTAIGVGRDKTSIVVLHGKQSEKCFLYKELNFLKSSDMFVKKTVTSTIFSQLDPHSSIINLILLNVDRV